jgi:hypothetical protein
MGIGISRKALKAIRINNDFIERSKGGFWNPETTP